MGAGAVLGAAVVAAAAMHGAVVVAVVVVVRAGAVAVKIGDVEMKAVAERRIESLKRAPAQNEPAR